MATRHPAQINSGQITPPALLQTANRHDIARQLSGLADSVEQIVLASARIRALRGQPYLGAALVGLIQVEAIRADLKQRAVTS